MTNNTDKTIKIDLVAVLRRAAQQHPAATYTAIGKLVKGASYAKDRRRYRGGGAR